MEPRSVEELMDLLYACRGDVRRHALRTAALLRRGRPADKELQLAGLLTAVAPLPWPGDASARADRVADAVRSLLGERVARLVRGRNGPEAGWDDDLLRLRQAEEEAHGAVFDAGVLEDWRTVLELVAARDSRLAAND
ncbi:hypothetical protein ABT301_12560 [Streptomyces sp. NPDC000987]|uniref:hypothetical protein n=1 Tax=Streptomyces sp. NPDC000987 TaxID=3154374 RepID=UPI0033277BFB